MATQAMVNQGVQVVEGNTENLWAKVRDFFAPVTDVLDIYISGPKAIEYLGSDYRTNLPEWDKSQIDAGLQGLHR